MSRQAGSGSRGGRGRLPPDADAILLTARPPCQRKEKPQAASQRQTAVAVFSRGACPAGGACRGRQRAAGREPRAPSHRPQDTSQRQRRTVVATFSRGACPAGGACRGRQRAAGRKPRAASHKPRANDKGQGTRDQGQGTKDEGPTPGITAAAYAARCWVKVFRRPPPALTTFRYSGTASSRPSVRKTPAAQPQRADLRSASAGLLNRFQACGPLLVPVEDHLGQCSNVRVLVVD